MVIDNLNPWWAQMFYHANLRFAVGSIWSLWWAQMFHANLRFAVGSIWSLWWAQMFYHANLRFAVGSIWPLWWAQMFYHANLRFAVGSIWPLWWAQMDSNHRPHAYQACALTSWAMSPCSLAAMVEVNGFEPMTPCLQGRCSTSWAIPPDMFKRVGYFRHTRENYKTNAPLTKC